MKTARVLLLGLLSLTLMARGGWRESRGCYLPSGIY